MTSYVLPGKPVASSKTEAVPNLLDGLLEIEEAHETWLGTSRDGDAAAARTDIGDVADDDIVEIRLRGGLKLWQSVADTRDDFASTDRSVADQALLVPRTLQIGTSSASRDGSSYEVEGVKVLKSGFNRGIVDDIAGRGGELTAVGVAHYIESKLDLGFHRCTRVDGPSGPLIQFSNLKKIDAKKPMLVLVHGTFSSTQGSFGDLGGEGDGQSDVWTKLEAAFPSGIFALEHRTVTLSPIQNALDLVKALPRGAKVSLLSHSRGGLVAELVARAARINPDSGKVETGVAFDETDRNILETAGEDTKLLDQLDAELQRKDIKVERLIRIAGPLGGATLASKRLDRALSIALNAMEAIPALKMSVAYDLFKAFLMGFVKAKNEALPGLEAMMPSSALVRLVNRADIISAGTLHVITGDNEGKGVFKRLRNLAVDLFFESDNDFVVNTPSMSKGLRRVRPPVVTPIVSSTITHFGYFRDQTARKAIATAAATSSDVAIPKRAGEDLMADSSLRSINVSRARDTGTLPTCFFLPGVMGSHLDHKGTWIWSNPIRLATGGLKRLRMPGKGVTADEMMDRYYGDLARFLSRSHDVILFPYDWRESVLKTGAEELAKEVRKTLNESAKPIRFLAHSMGGLVVRAFIDAHPALWAEIKSRPGSRFVMLGTPNGGSFSMVHTMMGRAKSIRQLAALDVTQSREDLLKILASMPGPAQLLPSDADQHYLDRATWNELRNMDDDSWVVPPERVFDAARAAHDLFERQQLETDIVHYIAGVGQELTPSSIKIEQASGGKNPIKFMGTWDGDGTVPWDTGIPSGMTVHYVDAVHGDMARTSSAFPAIFDLLSTGQTAELPTTPPARARDTGDPTAEVVDREIEVFPSDQDVVDSLLGAGTHRSHRARPAAKRTNVMIRHGDLRFTQHPVMVGHYQGDPIDGAEAALDGCLDYSMSQVREFGLYPGAIETCEVILRNEKHPSGAIIAGLGAYGELTPGRLSRTINRAVLRYVLTLRRRAAEQKIPPEEMDEISLTSLVIGHKGANMTVQQSVQAILEAVADANLTLGDTPIANVQFVEIFEDTAYRAAAAIHSATLNGPVAENFHFDRRIVTGDGSMLRMDYGLASSDWQRITASRPEDRPDVLNFTVIADGAKAQFNQTEVEPDIIEKLLEQSRKGTATDRDLGRLLFQLMIPLELKAFAQNDQKIQLIVDETTAGVPWELMEDAVSVLGDRLYQSTGAKDFRPLVVRTPVLRQLASSGAVVPRVAGNKVLVVGDPADTGHPALDGARREATRVALQLEEKGDFDVQSFIHTNNAIEIMTHLMRADYKIMHFAAHGVYEAKDDAAKTGLVLSNGVHLTSASIKGMEAVPEFVFLNCCHIGRIEENTGPIAADLSKTLIEKGVRAVIAAGWAVDDTAADLFAHEFYDSMLNNNTFGDAVHHARQVVFNRYPATNTWGAYQCYGAPEYRFDERGEGKDKHRERRTFYSADHARRAARNIQRDVESSHRTDGVLLAELDSLRETAPAEWLNDAGWCEDMGRAYAKLNVLDPAIALLERARANHRSTMTIHAVELLEVLKVRAATAAWQKADAAAHAATGAESKNAKKIAEDLKERQKEATRTALENLEALDAVLGSVNERREVLKGSVCKGKVLTYPKGAPRQNALREMIGYYRNAMDLAAEARPGMLKSQPTFNWLSGHVMLGSKDADGQPFDTLFDQLQEQNALRGNSSASFWTTTLPAEIDILRGLLTPPDARAEIFDRIAVTYRHAGKRGGARGQAVSILAHVNFLRSIATDPDQQAWLVRVLAVLNDT